MRKVIILLLMCLSIFPSITSAETIPSYTNVPLCEMTPYKFLDRIITRGDDLKVKIYDIHKSAQSGEIVFCKAGSPLHYCHITITAGNLPSGLTRMVRISCNDSSKETRNVFTTIVILVDETIGFSYQDAMLLLKESIPSPYKKFAVSSMWKDNRRIITWYEITSPKKSAISYYAVSGPRYIH